MKDFFIFLDIDGVMYDWKYILSLPRKGGRLDRFNPESVNALNKLISTITSQFTTHLVISSTWRKDMVDTKNVLLSNGIDLTNVTLESTPITNTPLLRGKEIIRYFNGNTDDKNYVIIDDELGDYLNYFPMSRIIKTNMQDDSLSLSKVKHFLNSHYIYFDNEEFTIT